jgi:hypothetical protein
MKLALTLVCLLGCYIPIAPNSPRATETFGDWDAPRNVGPPLNTPYNDNYAVPRMD